MEPQLVRRIDRNTVVGDKAAILKIVLFDEKKTHFLYRVGGIAFGVIRGESQFGEWIKLIGRFKAINFNDDTFVSGSAFLPPDLATMIATRLDKDETNQPQQSFLADVFVRYDKSLATSYGFIVEPVRPDGSIDPLEEMFKNAPMLPSAQPKQIEASKPKK